MHPDRVNQPEGLEAAPAGSPTTCPAPAVPLRGAGREAPIFNDAGPGDVGPVWPLNVQPVEDYADWGCP